MRTDIGTPQFMAPEQLKSLTLIGKEKKYQVGSFDDFKADVWSLGCLIWYVCTFDYPVRAETLEEMMVLANTGY